MISFTRFSGSVSLIVSEFSEVDADTEHFVNCSVGGDPKVGHFRKMMGKLLRGASAKVVMQERFPTFEQDFSNQTPCRAVCQLHPACANPS